MTTILYFLLIFSLVVFVHELGHFVVAKKSGIMCREFAIGFGPKLFVMRKGETLYTFRLLPLGGYVAMAGEHDISEEDFKTGQRIGLDLDPSGRVKEIVVDNFSNSQNLKMVHIKEIDLEKDLMITAIDENTNMEEIFHCTTNTIINSNNEKLLIAPANKRFSNKPLKNRFLTILAGPLMNFVLTLALFCISSLIYGIPSNEVREVEDGSPAEEALIQKGDIILSIDGVQMTKWSDIQSFIATHPGESVTITINRNKQEKNILLTIGETSNKVGEEVIKSGYIGIISQLDKSLFGSIEYGFEQTISLVTQLLIAIKEILFGGFSLDSLSGPVGIYKVTEEVADSGLYNIINFTAFLSLNLGVFNLLPIPALDGGKITFLSLEFIRGKKVDPKLEGVFQVVGFLLLITLMILVTWNDISKLY
ncbi:RIP metalloprotease RseP [Cytobacillus sp. FSL K6-0265]|uniref:RIP metalloprotease RseP n=1 Tax=Cytobacillus sp. FSL K6-0265 TaxID=2921448 RepID=UPI0030F786AC